MDSLAFLAIWTKIPSNASFNLLKSVALKNGSIGNSFIRILYLRTMSIFSWIPVSE
ncbi:hypothetical protein HMI56_006693 [Coelomomyces lativittatus]|nr:hypothetical protein HMI56_006693 [Coelomomyces lativittatus]